MIAIATADVVLQVLAYDDSFEAVTLYGTISDGKERGRKLVATARWTDRWMECSLHSHQLSVGHAQQLADRITGRRTSPTPANYAAVNADILV